jgi:hypothetical protein
MTPGEDGIENYDIFSDDIMNLFIALMLQDIDQI